MFDIPLHKLIIHFPIALTIIALLYDGWASYSNRPELHDTGYGLSLWAAVTSIVAVISGLTLAAGVLMESGEVTGHAMYGIAGGLCITVVGIWRYSARTRQSETYQIGWLVLQIAAAVLIAAAAVTGHRINSGTVSNF